MNIERLINVKQAKGSSEKQDENPDIDLVIEKIKKIQIKARPKKRSSLISHLETALKNKKSKDEITEIVEVLFERKILTELNGQLKYIGMKEET